jgi:hypothetical protein
VFHLTPWSAHTPGVEFHLRGKWLWWGISASVISACIALVHEEQDWYRSRGVLVFTSFPLTLSQCAGILWYRTTMWKGCDSSSLAKWLWTQAEWLIANLQFHGHIVNCARSNSVLAEVSPFRWLRKDWEQRVLHYRGLWNLCGIFFCCCLTLSPISGMVPQVWISVTIAK